MKELQQKAVELAGRICPGCICTLEPDQTLVFSHEDIAETIRMTIWLRRDPRLGNSLVNYQTATSIDGQALDPQGRVPEGWLPYFRVGWYAGKKCFANNAAGSFAALEQEFTKWASEWQPTPQQLTVKPVSPAPRPVWRQPPPAPGLESSGLEGLPDDVRKEVLSDIGQMNWEKILANYPADDDGETVIKARILLAAYGPATQKRQPCLILTGPETKKELKAAQLGQAGGFQLTVSQEYYENHDHSWARTRWLWTDERQPEPTEMETGCRALMREGRVSEACALAGVTLGEPVIRYAGGLPVTRAERPNPEWAEFLRSTLARLAPWKLAEALSAVEERISRANMKAPVRGKWMRRIADFPHQSWQSKLGLQASLCKEGGVLLSLDSSSSNARLPWTDWRDDPEK